ncbi:MAG: hypothetical protein US42_C0004G0015 [Candidatus Magasanikbacteria bacterium GW2011_GWC2_37_14]|uniref:Protein kinase domain-containing protein n=1 Tax=Candidatus Magasanikbacteria bacterium GW2011_GWC2_37_14 TaxID=1619046 RepID=A0A0G0JII1_9BACT|nr:MAG: hypothetical protein US42_C0004G0015 [Candidatus Magasanikbacteria bacterium GW2011_GWC2_37_14]
MLKEGRRVVPPVDSGSEILVGSKIDCIETGFNPNFSLAEFVEKRVADESRFLGRGGVGKVFELGHGLCIKIMENRHTKPDAHKYNLGNSPLDEFRIQNRLRGFEASGCFAPNTVACYAGAETSAIMMEQIDGAELQKILNGEEVLPDSFDFDTFFEALDDYLQEMHDRFGIVHNDLEPRNLMVDRTTGLPRLIDFGRSLEVGALDTQKAERIKNAELDKMDVVYQTVERFLNKIN